MYVNYIETKTETFRYQSLGSKQNESVSVRVDNGNHFALFFMKKGLQMVICFSWKNYVIIAIIVILWKLKS
jgi:hypothetical protein